MALFVLGLGICVIVAVAWLFLRGEGAAHSWASNALPPANVPPHWIEAEIWREWECPLNIVRGEERRKSVIARLANGPRHDGCLVPVVATLVREPSNSYDANAVRVEVADEMIGYVAREVARDLATVLDGARCPRLSVAGLIRGGRTDDPIYGVHLWLDKTLSVAPVITVLERSAYEVPWPPYEGEGT